MECGRIEPHCHDPRHERQFHPLPCQDCYNDCDPDYFKLSPDTPCPAAAERIIRYTVPVFVVIENGEITKVVVDDEHATRTEKVTPEIARILEHTLWPGWTFGW